MTDRGGERDKLSIVKSEVRCDELIDKIIGLSGKKSRPLKAICPFHNDTSPSLNVYTERWSCYVCNLHGDSIEFIKQHLKLGFREAVDYLYHEYLGYDKESAASRWQSSTLAPTYILPMSEHFPSQEERIAYCESILPFELFPYFMLIERCGPELLNHIVVKPRFTDLFKNYTALKWIAYWHNLPEDSQLECIRIWEEWCRRSETYHQQSMAWERLRQTLKNKNSLG